MVEHLSSRSEEKKSISNRKAFGSEAAVESERTISAEVSAPAAASEVELSNKSVACVHAANWLKTRKVFVRISLAVNIVVLIAVCTVLIAFSSSKRVVYAWGPPSSGRGILLSIYFAILIVSILLLVMHFWKPKNSAIYHMIAALLATQIIYKVSTPVTAGGTNPVAISNLCISGLHAVTLYLLWKGETFGPHTDAILG